MISVALPILPTGTKSFSVLNGTDANANGLMTIVPSKGEHPRVAVWLGSKR